MQLLNPKSWAEKWESRLQAQKLRRRHGQEVAASDRRKWAAQEEHLRIQPGCQTLAATGRWLPGAWWVRQPQSWSPPHTLDFGTEFIESLSLILRPRCRAHSAHANFSGLFGYEWQIPSSLSKKKHCIG